MSSFRKCIMCLTSFAIVIVFSNLYIYANSPADTSFSQSRKLIRIDILGPTELNDLEDLNLDFASHNFKRGAYVIVTKDEQREIERRGFAYEILIDDPSKVQIDPEYRDYEETMAYLDSLNQEYPTLTILEQVGVSQEYEIPIWAIKISDNPGLEEDEPEILFNGIHHAREPLSNEICLEIATILLENYGTDPEITNWVDSEEIWIVPIINPEGFKYVMDNNLPDPWWRKNMRDNNENGEFDPDYDGVDPNRNYDFNWSMGGSGNPGDDTYRGPFPFSESENQAIRDLATFDHRFIFSISYHSFGEVVFYPWEWPDNPAPDEDVISEVAQELASRIQRRDGLGTYEAIQANGLTGQSRNWFYGVAGTIDFIVETCDEFIPNGTVIDSIVNANLPGALYLLDRALIGPGITGHVTDSESSNPLQATVKILDRDTDILEPRTCDPNYGRYFRMLPPGEYEILYSMDGYGGRLEQVVVNSDTLTVLDVALSIDLSLALEQIDLDDDQMGQSNGNGDGLLNPGETIELGVWLENMGALPVYEVSCSLSTSDTLATIIEGTVRYGDFQPGEILDGDSPFVFSVSQNALFGDVISFHLTAMDSSSNVWIFDLDLTVYGVSIDYLSRAIDDSEGGDGDGIPEAGETIDLFVALGNTGSLPASSVWAELSSDDPFISILEDSSYFGDIEINKYAIGDPSYAISISPDVQDTHTVIFTLDINALDYYEEEEFIFHLGSLDIDEPDEEFMLPHVIRLHQNYPNPFNPTTTISFDIQGKLGKKKHATLTVYDLRGRLVKILISEKLEPGSHKVLWDGKNEQGQQVSSGIYLYTLKSGDKRYTRKMIMVK